jgi:methylase of polypeptide subunit release factors
MSGTERSAYSKEVELALVASRLAQTAEMGSLSELFSRNGIEVLHLPQPEDATLRGHRDPALATIRLLTRHGKAGVRRILERDGWSVSSAEVPDRRSRNLTRLRKGSVTLELADSIRVTHPLPRRLRSLERALWTDPLPGPSGFPEPRPGPLQALHDVRSQDRRIHPWRQPHEMDRPPRSSAVVDRLHTSLAYARESISMQRGGYGFLVRRRQARTVRVGELDIAVFPGVFAPRLPIALRMTEVALSCSAHVARPRVVEVGTGPGTIALGYAHERPDAIVVATDISFRAVACARANRDRLGLSSVQIVRGNLLDRLPAAAARNVDLIVANIPYVPPATASANEWGAPVETVRGSDHDGLGMVMQLAHRAKSFLRPGGSLVLQLTGWQCPALSAELGELGYDVTEPLTSGDDFAAVAHAIWPDDGEHPSISGGLA